jgi:hypothetical protein
MVQAGWSLSRASWHWFHVPELGPVQPGWGGPLCGGGGHSGREGHEGKQLGTRGHQAQQNA